MDFRLLEFISIYIVDTKEHIEKAVIVREA